MKDFFQKTKKAISLIITFAMVLSLCTSAIVPMHVHAEENVQKNNSVIEITAHPQDTVVTVGNITETLTVEVETTSVASGAALTFEWYSVEDGLLEKEDSVVTTGDLPVKSTFEIPSELDVGTYYYYCEVYLDGKFMDMTYDIEVRVVSADAHKHDGKVYEPFDITNENILKGKSVQPGNYYLDDDVTLNSSITISGNVNLCLNGHVLDGYVLAGNLWEEQILTKEDLTKTAIIVDGTFTICDCKETEHKYKTPNLDENKNVESGLWVRDEELGNATIKGGIISVQVSVNNGGKFYLENGTICGVQGVAVSNGGYAVIKEEGAVIGNYNPMKSFTGNSAYLAVSMSTQPIIYNSEKFVNYGKIEYNKAQLATVYNDKAQFYNYGTINDNLVTAEKWPDSMTDLDKAKSGPDEGAAAGGVLNYGTTTKPSKFYNYGQINSTLQLLKIVPLLLNQPF